MSQKWGSNTKCNISAYVIVYYTITGHLSEGNITFKCKTLGFMEIRVSKIPSCVCGRGGGMGWIRPISIHGLSVWISSRIVLQINFNE